MLSTLAATRIIFILGIVNLVAGLAIFFSCRCLPGSKITKNLMKHRWYQSFFKLHCYIWRVFWVSVAAHAILVMVYIGMPF